MAVCLSYPIMCWSCRLCWLWEWQCQNFSISRIYHGIFVFLVGIGYDTACKGRYKKEEVSFGVSSLISEKLKVKKVKHPTFERGRQVPAGNTSPAQVLSPWPCPAEAEPSEVLVAKARGVRGQELVTVVWGSPIWTCRATAGATTLPHKALMQSRDEKLLWSFLTFIPVFPAQTITPFFLPSQEVCFSCSCFSLWCGRSLQLTFRSTSSWRGARGAWMMSPCTSTTGGPSCSPPPGCPWCYSLGSSSSWWAETLWIPCSKTNVEKALRKLVMLLVKKHTQVLRAWSFL